VCALVLLAALPIAAAPAAADLARQIQTLALDPDECYRVVDLNFSKQDLRVYLTSGYLAFSKPIDGRRTAAVFVSDVEGGDAELLLIPPIRSERLSLAGFTGSPNMDEHFKSSVLLFTDNTAHDLLTELNSNSAKKSKEVGLILAEKWTPAVRSVANGFEVRLVYDLLDNRPATGLFYMAVGGTKLGNFDVVVDPLVAEEITVGQLAERNHRTFFDVWTSFAPHSKGAVPSLDPDSLPTLDNYRIEATLDADLSLKVVTRATLTSKQPFGRVLAFAISRKMRVLEVKIDGRTMEIFERQSSRDNLIRAFDEDERVLVVTSEPLNPATPHEVEFRHEGAVVAKAGDHVLYVGSRGNWYPRLGSNFAAYDLTFRYPRNLGFVATGDLVSDRTEGDWRITRRKSPSRIRFAGFNLGDYQSVTVNREPYRVDVYANRGVEAALRPKALPATVAEPQFSHRRPRTPAESEPAPMPTPDPTAHLSALARDIADAVVFMDGIFGPAPMRTLTVSPIPGGFGQGFPGLLYLSTLAYLDPAQRPGTLRDRYAETFFSELLDAHEVAHQWWGNLVVASSYQDVWLVEAMANYSALLFIEKKKGSRALEGVLDEYRTRLLAKAPSGHSLESAGPIIWSYRLESSQTPEAWHAITYEKGSWVIHMLRRYLGDDRFHAMLRELCRRYRYRALSTEQFRLLAQEFLPPDAPEHDLSAFFDNWVYGTGIPTVKLTCAVHGLRLTGEIEQSDVSDDFGIRVPIEIVTAHQRLLKWVSTSTGTSSFSIPLHQPPTKVSLASNDALMTVKK
jgi:hypothetical protein